MVERFFANNSRNVGPDAVLRPALLHRHQPVRLLDGTNNRRVVQRAQRAEVDHLQAAAAATGGSGKRDDTTRAGEEARRQVYSKIKGGGRFFRRE